MTKEYIYLVTDEIQLTPICEDCGPNLVPVMRKEELIRCRECRHYDISEDTPYCLRAMWWQDEGDDWFCAGAERKDDETD